MTDKQQEYLERSLQRLLEYARELQDRHFICTLERKDIGELIESYTKKIIKIIKEAE